jgi:hypothetical protein
VITAEPVCMPGLNFRWHLAGRTMADCERHTRHTMQAKRVRADHAAQLRDAERGARLVAVVDDLREYR